MVNLPYLLFKCYVKLYIGIISHRIRVKDLFLNKKYMGKIGVLEHPLNYKILHIMNNNESTYSTELARVLNKDQGNIGKRISLLHQNNFIKKGKRTKAQHYKVSFEGLFDEFKDILQSLVSLQDKELPEGVFDSDVLFEFYKLYVQDYLRSNSDGTIRKMVFEDFFAGLQVADNVGDSFPGDVKDLYSVLKSVVGGVASSYISVKYALDNCED